MKQALLFLLFLHVLISSAQKGNGSIRLCVKNERIYQDVDDTVYVSLQSSKMLKIFIIPPDSNGCIHLQKLSYGSYTLTLRSNDQTARWFPVVVKDNRSVLLNVELKSSIIILQVELIGIRPKPETFTPYSTKPANYVSSKQQRIGDSLYASRRKKQKLEHQQLKDHTWRLNDSIRGRDVIDTADWKASMKQDFPYPKEAIEMGIEGRQYFSFETDETGTIQNLIMHRGYDAELTVPFAHYLNQSPGLTPPKNEVGVPQWQKYFLVMKFKLVD